MSVYRNKSLLKCPFTGMFGFRSISLPNSPIPKYPLTEISFIKMHFNEIPLYLPLVNLSASLWCLFHAPLVICPRCGHLAFPYPLPLLTPIAHLTRAPLCLPNLRASSARFRWAPHPNKLSTHTLSSFVYALSPCSPPHDLIRATYLP